jgi:radical SAM superfamily enzyme YgiQ (UPF0313 family)
MDDALPRHSLLHLSGPLRLAGNQVDLIDLRLLRDWSDYERTVRELSPDVLCVTAHTSEIDFALECCRRAKRVHSRVTTVGGGIHLTMFPELGADDGSLDFVIRGEGEESLPKLVANPAGWPRVSWGEAPDLDAIPFEDRELYPDYRERTRFPLWDLPTPIVDLLTKRGCPWQCRFCCGPGEQNLYTKPSPTDEERRLPTFRHRSVDSVIAEMEILWQRYGFRGVVFHDDQFLIRKDWVIDFCAALHESGFVDRGIRWWAASRADIVCRHPDVIESMRDAGLRILSIGFESFDDEMLRWMRKDTTVAENLEAAEICRRLGLDIYANVILGMPDSGGRWHLEHDRASLEAIRQIRPRYFSPSFFSPIPGSWFFEWALENDLLVGGDPRRAGSRNPAEAKIRGVDYERLGALLSEHRAAFPDETIGKKTLAERLRHFLDRPLLSKVRVIRDRVVDLGRS